MKKPNTILTAESGPLSAPGHVNDTNSLHRLCTTKLQTGKKKGRNEYLIVKKIRIDMKRYRYIV